MERADIPTDVLEENGAVGAETDIRADFNERYKILRLLGRGGMAVVHLARDRRLNQQVALKVFTPTADAQAMQRILREARAGRELNHPNVVRVHDLLETSEGPVIVMEYVEGKTLREVMKEKTSLPVQEALAVFDQILQGLEALHQAGIIHRDIKPENVFVMPDGKVKIGDFSICVPLTGTRLTADARALGTPQYMAPEQIEGKAPAFATDIYAAGIVLYEMLSGKRPFDGDNPSQVIHKQLHTAPDLRNVEHGRAPLWLRAFIARCLAKSPRERWATIAATRHALQTHRIGISRFRLLRTAALCGTMVLLAGAGITAYNRFGARRVNDYRVDGNEVHALDSKGGILWSRRFDFPIDSYLAEDMNGNGKREFIGFSPGSGNVETPFYFYYLNAEGVATVTEDQAQSYDLDCSGGWKGYFNAADMDGDGAKEIVCSVMGDWYPTYLYLYSTKGNRLLGMMRHPGCITNFKFQDINGDGYKDLLAVGMNNVLGHSFVFWAVDGKAFFEGDKVRFERNFRFPGFPAQEEPPKDAPLLFYTFLPLESVQDFSSIQWSEAAGGGWEFSSPTGAKGRVDRFGNVEGGPTAGMGEGGREELREYYGRIDKLALSGLHEDDGIFSTRDADLPRGFVGREPWDRIFRLVRSRTLARCGRVDEALAVLKALAETFPKDQEVSESYGKLLFLNTGNPKAAEPFVLANADKTVCTPVTAYSSWAKIMVVSGGIGVRDIERFIREKSNIFLLEKTKVLLALGEWALASTVAEEMKGHQRYPGGTTTIKAVVSAARGMLSDQEMQEAMEDARSRLELLPLANLAEAISKAKKGEPSEARWIEDYLFKLKKASAYDLDARLYLKIYQMAVVRDS